MLPGLRFTSVLCTQPRHLAGVGAIILVATACSMFWGRLAFAFFAEPILNMDAQLTAWLAGTEHIDNIVRMGDDSGYFVILPGCSSFANVSLVVLTWILGDPILDRLLSLRDFLWCGLACASVIAVNIGRLSIMAFNMDGYFVLHSELGAAISQCCHSGNHRWNQHLCVHAARGWHMFKRAVGLLLALTIGWKIAIGMAPRLPQHENFIVRLSDFFGRQHLAVAQAADINDALPLVEATKDNCRVTAVKLDSRGIEPLLGSGSGGSDDQVFSCFAGQFTKLRRSGLGWSITTGRALC